MIDVVLLFLLGLIQVAGFGGCCPLSGMGWVLELDTMYSCVFIVFQNLWSLGDGFCCLFSPMRVPQRDLSVCVRWSSCHVCKCRLKSPKIMCGVERRGEFLMFSRWLWSACMWSVGVLVSSSGTGPVGQ